VPNHVGNLRSAIRKRKARNLIIDSVLARPVTTIDAYGRIWRASTANRQRLAEEKLHNEEVIADLEGQIAAARPKTVRKPEDSDTPRQSAEAPVVSGTQLRIQRGEWASNRYEELRKLNAFAIGKIISEQILREKFPDLRIWEVVDRLYSLRRVKFIDEVSCRRLTHVDCFNWIAEYWNLSGTRLYDNYKEYRKAQGIARSRAIRSPAKSSKKDS
jgi:hypothetical protein